MTTDGNLEISIRSVPSATTSVRLWRLGAGMVTLGLIASIVGILLDSERTRTAYGYLWGYSFFWTVCLGALLLVALHHLTKAVWSVVFRRIMEMFASPVWLLAILFVPLMLIAVFGHQIGMFPWSATEQLDHVVHDKAPYLNLNFFLTRAAIYFAVWIGFSLFFVRRSLGQDNGDSGEQTTLTMRRYSAPFIVLFAVTTTFAAIDWLMSLEPLWFSTMFGVYVFSGMILSALAAVTFCSLTFIKHGRMGKNLIKDDHIYNLGTLMFTFTVFWGYIAFSQYMLIWYANMPEESFYIQRRLDGMWLPVSMALGVVRFAIPFLMLLSRPAKTDRRRLQAVSVVILLGQLLDLYWLIMPQSQDSPPLGWQELGPLVLTLGLFALALAAFMKKNKTVPVGDPLLEESICFRL